MAKTIRSKHFGSGDGLKISRQDVTIRHTSEPVSGILINVSKAESRMTSMEKMKMVQIGVSKSDLENLKEKAALGYDTLARMLSVGRATLINKKGKEKFAPVLSEKIVSLADIYSYGYEVFQDAGRFNQWIFKPNQALGGKTPYSVLDNQFGREEVRSIIGRIDYGVYS